jgi:ABC-2 type transport system permease protein
VSDTSISKDHIVSTNLNELLFAEAGFFESVNSNLSVDLLVSTSTETNVISKADVQENSTEDLALNFKSKNNKISMLAAYLSGVISSPFINKSETVRKSRASVFAISDVDWIYNGFSLADARMGDRVFSRPINDNHKLFLNMVEYITGDTQLTNIRSRKSPIRTFTSIEKMLLQSRQLYHERESDYATRIKNTEQSIAKVLNMTGAKNIDNLPVSLKQQIRNLRLAAYPIRRELRDIRLKMRKAVDDRFKTLTIMNLLAGPILALFVFSFLRRLRKVQS